ncbi:MAG: hypothetical protein JNL45_04850 [Hyphomicrobium sp.]|nr:hypothetical protein [Hyphomicrobium sp.]
MTRDEDEERELRKDIAALQAFRASRLRFTNRIIEISADKSEGVASVLRSDPFYQLAEFYFLLSGFNIESTAEFAAYIERHNSYLTGLLKDPAKMLRMGLKQDRLLAAILDGETTPRVLRLWSESKGTLDQSTLGRLLVPVMSDETARKVVIAATKAGFLTREASVYRMMMVASTGTLETIYGQCLREFRSAIANFADPETNLSQSLSSNSRPPIDLEANKVDGRHRTGRRRSTAR